MTAERKMQRKMEKKMSDSTETQVSNDSLVRLFMENGPVADRVKALGTFALRMAEVVDRQAAALVRVERSIDTIEMILYPLIQVLTEEHNLNARDVLKEERRSALAQSGNILKYLGLDDLIPDPAAAAEEEAKAKVAEMYEEAGGVVEKGVCERPDGVCPHPHICTANQKCMHSHQH